MLIGTAETVCAMANIIVTSNFFLQRRDASDTDGLGWSVVFNSDDIVLRD